MRWLYKIFRLFKCPHKYTTYDTIKGYCNEKDREKKLYIHILNYQECVRCGYRRSIKT